MAAMAPKRRSQLQGPDDSVVKYARTEETGEPMCD